jgi:phosphopantothenoylcysteine decarboxylase/phosphopantothenate--cysteine ligase
VRLSGKKILLGITGCIAAYKAAYLLRQLKREGADVRVMMTKAACAFVAPLTFESLSGRPVSVEMFPREQFTSVHHIFAAEWADLILIAPATADVIGKIASGVSDDLLTTTVCAAQSPVMLAPAMNSYMWTNSITQLNVEKLKSFGYLFIDPVEGDLASWATGPGRFPEPDAIVDKVAEYFQRKSDFVGVKLLVTAGPTYEYIDPVRFIGNPSTGTMGFAIAEAATERGAEVILIAGPTQVNPPGVAEFCSVVSTGQMADAVMERIENCRVAIMAAAPSDYTPASSYTQKIKKSNRARSIRLNPTVDILKEAAATKGDRIHVGFALETESEITNARKKLREKKLDMIIVNNPTAAGAGFGFGTNEVTILTKDGKPGKVRRMPKRDLAELILDRVRKLLK